MPKEFNIEDLITPDKKTIEQGGHTKKKQGRPPMTEPKKDKRVVGYLTEDEYTSLKEEAKRRDINIATLVRIAILNL